MSPLPFCIQKEGPSWTVGAPARAAVGTLTSAGPAICGSSAALTVTTAECATEAAQGTMETLVARATSARTHAPLDRRTSLGKGRFTDKIITNVETTTAEHESKH